MKGNHTEKRATTGDCPYRGGCVGVGLPCLPSVPVPTLPFPRACHFAAYLLPHELPRHLLRPRLVIRRKPSFDHFAGQIILHFPYPLARRQVQQGHKG